MARQGIVVAAPDPLAPVPIYFVPRGSPVETVTILSYGQSIHGPATGGSVLFCFDIVDEFGLPPEVLPETYNHTVVPLLPNIQGETGVTGPLGGEVSFGYEDM